MRSAALRWTIFFAFIVVLLAAGYFVWKESSVSRAAAAAAESFDDRAHSLTLSVMELRMSQQAYVAAGQGDEFWGSRVAGRISALREELIALRALASSPQAQQQIDEAGSALGDFERMDARAREYTRGNQRLLASDLIFSDGLEKTEAMVAAVAAARRIEKSDATALERATRRRELLAAGATAASAVAVGLLLVPSPKPTIVEKIIVPPALPLPESEGLMLRDARDPAPPLPAETPPSIREVEPEPRDPLDLGRVASLCTELARVSDNRSLPAVLERTAMVLDANGVVLWIADPDGRELNPIVTHGYPPQLVTRLGTIPRDAQNATAAAFRTSLMQTVDGDSISNGAIAVPLITPAGCVGVMAAEVRHGGEKEEGKLAAAAIVAAQLATLVGPPPPRVQGRPEAARA
jgi:hypothetical protein